MMMIITMLVVMIGNEGEARTVDKNKGKHDPYWGHGWRREVFITKKDRRLAGGRLTFTTTYVE